MGKNRPAMARVALIILGCALVLAYPHSAARADMPLAPGIREAAPYVRIANFSALKDYRLFVATLRGSGAPPPGPDHMVEITSDRPVRLPGGGRRLFCARLAVIPKDMKVPTNPLEIQPGWGGPRVQIQNLATGDDIPTLPQLDSGIGLCFVCKVVPEGDHMAVVELANESVYGDGSTGPVWPGSLFVVSAGNVLAWGAVIALLMMVGRRLRARRTIAKAD